jgi:hypothetical protein
MAMPDDRVIDINSRTRRADKPSIWAMAEQMISMEGIRETLAVIGDITYEVPELQLFASTPNRREINQRVHDIIWNAVGELEQFEDSLRHSDA